MVPDSVSGSGAIEDAVLFAGLKNHNGGDYVYLSLGYIDTTYTVGRVAVKLPGLYNSTQYDSVSANHITSVKFYCWDTSGHETHLINLHPITGPACVDYIYDQMDFVNYWLTSVRFYSFFVRTPFS